MATRSLICKQSEDKTITGIYCHWDGYPDGVGETLKEHYVDPNKIDKLLELGSISSLAPEIGDKHSFNKPTSGWVVAYHRDRGEDFEDCHYVDMKDLMANARNHYGVDYVYVWSPFDNKWHHYKA